MYLHSSINRFTGLGEMRETNFVEQLLQEPSRQEMASLSPTKQVNLIEERTRHHWPELKDAEKAPGRTRRQVECEALSRQPKF